MKITDLRIGNLVSIANKEKIALAYIVNGLHADGKVELCVLGKLPGTMKIVEEHISNVTPLPLSIEMFRKAGFTRANTGAFKIVDQGQSSDYLKMALVVNDEEFKDVAVFFEQDLGDGTEKKDVCAGYIGSMHELQNFWHAIKGEELEYNF